MSEEQIVPDRFTRQQDLVPQDWLTNARCTVIGVGAIGRQVAMQLAAIGARNIQLIDFDVVDLSNTTTQGYYVKDIGQPKVQATTDLIHNIDGTILVDRINDRFRVRHETGQAVFCCVDSITAREAIWKALRDKCAFWTDGRMLGEIMRVISVADDASREYYETTLFTAAEAEPGRCTARSTIYAASIAAGLMIHQFTRFLRRAPIDKDLQLSLFTSELTVD